MLLKSLVLLPKNHLSDQCDHLYDDTANVRPIKLSLSPQQVSPFIEKIILEVCNQP